MSSYLVLVAPADRDPAEFDWSLVAPQAPATVVPFDCGDDFAERLAVAILRDGSDRVVVTRLETYRAQTAPLIDYYSRRGLLSTVDTARHADEVQADVARLVEAAGRN